VPDGITLGALTYRVLHCTIGSDQQVLGTVMTLLPMEAMRSPTNIQAQADAP
jgi:hypothetical protein